MALTQGEFGWCRGPIKYRDHTGYFWINTPHNRRFSSSMSSEILYWHFLPQPAIRCRLRQAQGRLRSGRHGDPLGAGSPGGPYRAASVRLRQSLKGGLDTVSNVSDVDIVQNTPDRKKASGHFDIVKMCHYKHVILSYRPILARWHLYIEWAWVVLVDRLSVNCFE